MVIQWAANEETHPRLWEAQEGVQEKVFQRQQSALKALSCPKSGHKSKKVKNNKADKEGISAAGQKKPCTVHHPSLVWWPLLRNRLPTLCVIVVRTKPIPLLVTPRSPRSVRSQRSLNRLCMLTCAKAFDMP